MRHFAILILSLLLGPDLGAQQERPAAAAAGEPVDPSKLEARLAVATGTERIDLLIELATAYRRADPARAIGHCREALEMLPATPDEDRELSVLYCLGDVHIQLREYEPGLRYLEQAERLARRVGNKLTLAFALQKMGVALRRTDERGRALEALTEATDLFEDLGHKKGQGLALLAAGGVFSDRGDSRQALEHCFRAYRLFEEVGDLHSIGKALNNIAIQYKFLGQIDEALDFYHRSLEIRQQLGDLEGIGRLLNNIGIVHRRTGDPGKALEIHLRALEIREQLGIPRHIARTLDTIGLDYRDLGEPEQAIAYIQRSLAIWEEIGNRWGLASALLHMGQLHRQAGRYQTAREVLERALALATEAGLSQLPALGELVEVYGALGLSREMLAAFRRYDAITKEQHDEEKTRSIAEMQARFDADQKEKEIELLQQQQTLQALELERQRGSRRTLVGGFGLVLLIVFLAFNRFRLKAQQALMVETVEQERRVSAQLRELDSLKDEFLANTSHELRTPLYGIIGLAESLVDGARGELPGPARADLSMLAHSGRRLTALVNDILDFSKLRHHSLKIEFRPVDLRALVDVVLTLSRPLVGSKELELASHLPDDLPAVLADENRLQQILHNLVGNAVKFTESGRVEVAAEQQDGRVVVSVRDTGIGIAEDQQERIFEAFAQSDASTERLFAGTGLGLAVTRELIDLHGGGLGVESVPGEGSTFFFDLEVCQQPAEPAAVQPTPALAEAEAAEPVAPLDEAARNPIGEVAASPRRGDGASLLVVDDEPVVRRVVTNQLAAQGFRVTTAADGAEALRRVAEHTIDLVILDVMMPRMSGFEVCRKLRESWSLEELPIIFLTARNQAEDLVVGLAAGANDYLPKPVSKSELQARVQTHMALLLVNRQLSGLVSERTSQLAERERLLAERERLISQLEARNAELARFNYTVAHDLKNPLTTIRNFIGLLRRDAVAGDRDRLRSDIRRIDDAAARLQQMLGELYEVSSIDRAAMPCEEVAFRELVLQATGELAPTFAERGIEVDVARELPVVCADSARLLEAIRHLLRNAVQYLGDQPSPEIEVGTRRGESAEGEPPILYVRDNGIGIDPRYHDQVFDLFERLEPEASEGTGIGLALVQRIVEVHGGRIWIESDGRGSGSTFCFTLPG